MAKIVTSTALAHFKERMVELIDTKIKDATLISGDIATIEKEEIKSLFRKENSNE